jgi:hypothetical protein
MPSETLRVTLNWCPLGWWNRLACLYLVTTFFLLRDAPFIALKILPFRAWLQATVYSSRFLWNNFGIAAAIQGGVIKPRAYWLVYANPSNSHSWEMWDLSVIARKDRQV